MGKPQDFDSCISGSIPESLAIPKKKKRKATAANRKKTDQLGMHAGTADNKLKKGLF